VRARRGSRSCSFIAISIGAMLCALARYGLSLTTNALLPNIPMGTLACTLIAACIVGFAIAFFGWTACLSVVWRLFLITGLAGGLSTFSTFSAEMLTLLRDGCLGWAVGTLALHFGDSLVMTALGMATLSLTRHI